MKSCKACSTYIIGYANSDSMRLNNETSEYLDRLASFGFINGIDVIPRHSGYEKSSSDHILYRNGDKCVANSFFVIDFILTDHYPIILDLRYKWRNKIPANQLVEHRARRGADSNSGCGQSMINIDNMKDFPDMERLIKSMEQSTDLNEKFDLFINILRTSFKGQMDCINDKPCKNDFDVRFGWIDEEVKKSSA